MPEFAYVAKDARGAKSTGVIAAASRSEALQRLRGQSLFPMSVTDQAPPTNPLSGLSLGGRIKKEHVADLCTQLADLLGNGVPLLEALKILGEATPQPKLQAAIDRVHEKVTQGMNLDQALEQEPAVFTELTVSMVRAGLEGAFLEEALQRTAAFLRKQDEMRAKIVGAMTYPMILGGVGGSITLLMIVFLVPKFQPFFDRLEQSGAGLPTVTVLLLGLSHSLMRYWFLMPLAVVAVLFGGRRLLASEAGRAAFDQAKLKLPVFGDIFHDAAVARMCRVLGTLLRNGVPLLRSLQISSQSTGNRLLEQVMILSAENITSGDTLCKPLAASGLIPPQVMAMIRVAEESNTLDDVLVKIADRCDQRVERRLEVLVRMIEPLMLVMIGAMVMFVIVGVLLPVFDLNSTVG